MASNFDRLAQELAKKPGVTNPRGLAYKIGVGRYGKKTMAKAAQRGVSARTVARGK